VISGDIKRRPKKIVSVKFNGVVRKKLIYLIIIQKFYIINKIFCIEEKFSK